MIISSQPKTLSPVYVLRLNSTHTSTWSIDHKLSCSFTINNKFKSYVCTQNTCSQHSLRPEQTTVSGQWAIKVS